MIIISIVALAKIMAYSGMIKLIADVLFGQLHV
ncbi:hypothetical protein [Clostridium sp.]